MNDIADGILANRRLAILKLLVEDGGHSNESVLELALRELGHRKGLDRAAVRQMMRELEERACVTLQLFRDTVLVAHITDRGRLAAIGDISVAGIASPHIGG
ncbi:MAG: hypothetical protein DI623_11380 [Sphingomonas sanxanigenens]|uniref:ArsR family transcriptional regulator n=1 Tax=Sphingomonas sanxanigenens TaxID=397260 RepID=A0A2W5A3F3_9SPHN|nr:MAG: hypothetical protein DI623_11380 [Sphingomonas sanxanigenens]